MGEGWSDIIQAIYDTHILRELARQALYQSKRTLMVHQSLQSSTRGSVESAKDDSTNLEDKVNSEGSVDTETEDFNFKGFPDCGTMATNAAAGGGSKLHYVTRSGCRGKNERIV
ncbi:hypothetical protein PR048_021131 [Dryococelus australis]|uniref:Uncharacterized protein n=1 Tax=Dryococelus australis TaxID=614101 RepID=A0ABQ9GXB9_9NEOP|nr:hypothetical protein PR048_021131 [Dryococelus australis]